MKIFFILAYVFIWVWFTTIVIQQDETHYKKWNDKGLIFIITFFWPVVFGYVVWNKYLRREK